MKQQKITIYLADDHKIVIDGLKLLIDSEPTLRVAGWATDGDAAYEEILEKRPDIALLDFRMPGKTGIDLVTMLRKKVDTKFVILSMHNEDRFVQDARNYGAYGYLVKNAGKEELMRCIDQVLKGEFYFPSQRVHKTKEKNGLFTNRQLEIIKLIVDEYTTQQIAEELNLSPLTVETHRKNICKTSGTKNPIGLLKFVKENGIEL